VLDWLLVGGGVHGTHLSLALTARLGWPRDRVRVLDPHPEPLALWTRQTANTGMAFMRSSLVHHIGVDPYDLQRFARTPGAAAARFAAPYHRPAYALFQAHAAHVVAAHRLDALRVRGRAAGLARIPGGWRIETADGALDARRVVLALGLTEQPCRPAWADALAAEGASHLFDPAFDRAAVPEGEAVAVVGGGISAVQAAVALARRGPTILVARHALREHVLDADPGWMGPKRLRAFWAEAHPERRRTAIDGARHRGSVPPDVQRALRHALRSAPLEHLTAEVESARPAAPGRIRLRLRAPDGAAQSRTVDRLVLATGFDARRPGGAWLDDAVVAEGLPVAPCGSPRVAPSLAWAPGLYTAGPLAELELGPVARNIVGARMAAERLPAAQGPAPLLSTGRHRAKCV
jgi:hypothetical protein